MLKQKNVFIAGILVLSLSGQAFGQVNNTNQVPSSQQYEFQRGSRIYGREESQEQLFRILDADEPAFIVGAEGSGRDAVVEGMQIDREEVITRQGSEKRIIVHDFDVGKAMSETNATKVPRADTDITKDASVYESILKAKETIPLFRLHQAIDEISNLNRASVAENRNERHVLRVTIDGNTPGVKGKEFSGGFYEALQLAMNRKSSVGLIIKLIPEVFENSFGKNSDLNQVIYVKRVEEDNLKLTILKKLNAFNEESVKKKRPKISLSPLVVEEFARIIRISKNSASQMTNIDRLLNQLQVDKRIGSVSALVALDAEFDKRTDLMAHEENIDRLKALNFERFEIELKRQAIELKRDIETEDIEKFKKDKSAWYEKFVEKFKEKLGAKAKIDWSDVVPSDERELRALQRRINNFANEVIENESADVSIKALHRVAQKPPFSVDKTSLNLDPNNIRKNLRKTLDQDLVGLDYFKNQVIDVMDEKLFDREKVKADGFKAKSETEKDIAMMKIAIFGATGLGKTEAAKSIAKALGAELLRINGNEVAHGTDIRGSSKSFVGYNEPTVWQPILDNPSKLFVVLFDELDKLSSEARKILMTALDEGTLTLGNGKVVSFKNTVMIFSANYAKELFKHQYMSKGWREYVEKELKFNIEEEFVKAGAKREDVEQKVMSRYLELKEGFKPEEAARFGTFLLLRNLNETDARKIATKMLMDFQDSYNKKGFKVVFGEDIVERIAESYDRARNARGIHDEVMKLRQKMISQSSKLVDQLKVSRKDFFTKNMIVVNADRIVTQNEKGESVRFSEPVLEFVTNEDFAEMKKQTVLTAEAIEKSIQDTRNKLSGLKASQRQKIVKDLTPEQRLRMTIDDYATQRYADEKPRIYGDSFLTKEMLEKIMARKGLIKK